MLRSLLLAAGLGLAASASYAAPLPIDTFIKRAQYRLMKISPTGEYLAVSIPMEGEEVVAVINRKTMTVSPALRFGAGESANNFWWAGDERLVVQNNLREGGLAQPKLTGELYAMDADGSNIKPIFGYRAGGATGSTGTHIKRAQSDRASAKIIDLLDDNEDEILIASSSWDVSADGAYAVVYRLNIHSGAKRMVTRAPVRNAHFLTDSEGHVRYAVGTNAKNHTEVYYRAAEGGEWGKKAEFGYGDEGAVPDALSRDGRFVYQRASLNGGPTALFRLELATGKQELLLHDPVSDLTDLVLSPDGKDVVGAEFMPDRVDVKYLDAKDPYVRLHKGLRKAFGGDEIHISSFTKDGRQALVRVYSDRNPGDYYLIDTKTKKAEYVASAMRWVDPTLMAEMKPVTVKARDGLELRGYLTTPPGVPATNLPLIVHPHGGPHGPRDEWGYDPEVQMLANQGYAVLQINFRGSGGYGLDFETAGHRQWGRKMQDDVTDATNWAIEQKIADRKRICIYGGSYGGYAALMGAIREPELYRCAVTYVGVTDLELMYSNGDTSDASWGVRFLEQVLGKDEAELKANSPAYLVDRLKAPVLIIQGGADKRVPPSHAEALRDALEDKGKSFEWLYKPNEGHGFYDDDNRKEVAEKLLAFFGKHIGPGAVPALAAK